MARRLVAGRGQQEEVDVELALGQGLAVDLRLHELRDDVVARVRAPVGGELAAVLEHLERDGRREGQVAVALELLGRGELRVGVAQEPVAEVDDVAPVLLRRAEHLREHAHRQLRRDVLDEVELAQRQRVVEDPVDELADLQLVGPHGPRREALGHQRPQLVVARGVHVDHRLARLDLVGAQVLQRRPAGLGGEGLPVAVHGVDVVVARDAPEPRPVGLVLEEHRVLAAQQREHLVRDALHEVVVVGEVDVLEAQVGGDAHGRPRP